jgi:histone-arginine methyltransferase CARM1
MGKARFWEQTTFHGVDLSPLYPDAKAEMFGKALAANFQSVTTKEAISQF